MDAYGRFCPFCLISGWDVPFCGRWEGYMPREMKTPRYELHETNHGIDGWDAKTTLAARFSTSEKAEAWLAAKGYTFRRYGSFYHQDEAKRHTMGCVSFKIVETACVDEDPVPDVEDLLKMKESAINKALAKLTPEDRRALGIG
jgi:hypothetical protein